MNIFRGTTPTLQIALKQHGAADIDLSTITALDISFQQNGKILLTKKLDDVTIINNKFVMTLTQEETLQFKEGRNITIQARYLIGGVYNAYATFKKDIGVNGIIKEGVLNG